ncbi:MAG TPA: HlyD family secretion protein [Steroidobacteraceae bacterium]|nr:HlyD family secretion protein [Steroidobacteraceae bacterium]
MDTKATPIEDAPMSEAPPAAPVETKKPRDPVKTITKGVLITLLVLFIYHVASDRVTPYTSQSNIEAMLVQIAPQVSGQVIEVATHDNERVTKGQLLYRIDAEPFEIALRVAEANLALVEQNLKVSTAQVRSTQASLSKQRTELATSKELGGIIFDLTKEKALSETDSIRARSEIERAGADLARAEADLESAKQKLGPPGDANPQLQQARAALAQARLDFTNTTVLAPADGMITNLRLSRGQYANRGQPVMSFIPGDSVWLTAYLRENQLGKVARGNTVRVAFDLLPGRVFDGKVDSVGWGVTRGGEAPAGTLPDVQSAKGWLREPQRFPVRIALDAEASSALGNLPLRNGAQANVLILTNPNSWLLNPLGRIWLRIVSWMSYFY